MRKIYTTLVLIGLAVSGMAQDGYLNGPSLTAYQPTGTPLTLEVKVRNSTSTPITTGSVTWQLDNGSTNSTPFNIGGGGITTNTYIQLTLTPYMTLPTDGAHQLKVWINVVPDIDHSNDTITLDLMAISNYADNKVLIEKKTGTWCPNCPVAADAFNDIAGNNPNAVLASFHSMDEYSFSEGSSYLGSYGGSFTPAGVINMGEFGNYEINFNSPSWESEVESRVGISPVDLALTASVNTSTRVVTMDAVANFKHSMTGEFMFNAYIVENNIEGAQQGATNPYTHQHIVRHMLGGVSGESGQIPTSPVLNTDYTYSKTYTIPVEWNLLEVEIVVVIFELADGLTNALNAESQKLYPAGINNTLYNNEIIRAYPNPVTDVLHLRSEINGGGKFNIQAIDASGKRVMEKSLSSLYDAQVDVNGLETGLYLFRVYDSGNEIARFKLQKK